MDDDMAFLRAIRERPDDDLPRLIYADYLDERGQSARAEFIRVGCERARLPDGDYRHRQLVERELELLADNQDDWERPFPAALTVRFDRGFAFSVEMEAHQFLSVPLGTINTTVLLLSSWSMVMAVFNGQKGRRAYVLGFLTVTQLCALAFLCIKAVEYTSKFKEGLFPNARFDYAKALTESHEHGAHVALSPRHDQAWRALEEASKGEKVAETEAGGEKALPQPQSAFVAPTHGIARAAGLPEANQIREALRSGSWSNFQRESNKARIFFSIYFTMTGLHGVHVIIGMLLMGALMYFYGTKHHCVDDYIPLELIGLYWHFVDIVWIFLFPLMYLIS